MKKALSFLMIIALYSLSIIEINLHAHGFEKHTLLKKENGFQTIEYICKHPSRKNKRLESYDLHNALYTKESIKHTGVSISNCYINIVFNQPIQDQIVCTPTQEFYLVTSRQWVPAYTLKPKDLLLSYRNTPISISHIEFIPKIITVYSVEIKNTHTFFVGKNAVLTHNVALPALYAGVTIPFGTGSIGGLAGGILGPVGIAGGIAIGGVVGIAIKTYIGNQIIPYQLSFDIQHMGELFHKNNDKGSPAKTVEDILKDTTPGRKTNGKSKQFEKPGNFDDAIKDFDDLKPERVKEIENGKIGILSDGKKINVRRTSSSNNPTLEVYNPKNRNRIKIRYL